MSRRLAVIGGGISGLTLAWAALRARPDLEVRLFEGRDRIGGAIESRRVDDLLMEGGPDSMITDKPAGLELCRDLGLEDLLQATSSDDRRAMVVKDGRLVPIPEGFRLLAPTRFLPFVLSPVISFPGKLRMGLDLFLPPRRDEGDETLASFVVRRLGREALERLAQPLVGGIYGGDPEKLSLQATMPRFMELEKKYGSVTRGMLAGIAAARKAGGGAPGGGTSGARYGLFASLEGGIETLVRRLEEVLPAGTVLRGRKVASVRPHGGGWVVATDAGEETFDAVALAMPTWSAAELVGFDPDLSRELAAINYHSSAAVNLVYRRDQIPGKLDAFGWVVPRIEGRVTLACTYASVKYAGRAPADKVILRGFAGGSGREADVDKPPEELVEDVKRDFRDLMKVKGEPEYVWSARHHKCMPHYELHHLDRVAAIERKVLRHPGLFLTGNGFRGVGIPDCAKQARDAAGRAADYLASHSQ